MNPHKQIKNIILVIVGTFILAFGTYNLHYQNNISEGGILGLLLFFKNILNISPSLTNIILDLLLFLFAFKFFGKRFLYYSILSTISFSVFYNVLENFNPIIPSLSDHMFIASLLAGIIVGTGVGLVILGGGAAGGDDAVALLLSKFTPLKINHVYLIMDVTVLLLSLVYLQPAQVFWSIVTVFISGKVISLYHSYTLS